MRAVRRGAETGPRIAGAIGWGIIWGMVAAAPLFGALAGLAGTRWGPTFDEAIIAWRAWDVLTPQTPLVGQFTQASATAGAPVFSPGPLLYWPLAVPTRIAPGIGPAVGATLLQAATVVTACVAAARTPGRGAAPAVAAAMLVLSWSLAAPMGDLPLWNPYVTLLPFAAALVLAWVVASGRLSWWPGLVLLASLCAQGHLVWAPTSAGLVVVALALGLLARASDEGRPLRNALRVRERWLLAGVAVAVIAWAPPVAQQVVAGDEGNLGRLARSILIDDAPTIGLDHGVAALGVALAPPQPAWLEPPKRGAHLAPEFLDPGPGALAWGVAGLALLTLVVGLAARARRREVLAPAAVALVGAVGVSLALAGVAEEKEGTLNYLRFALWPVSLLVWAVLAGAGWTLFRARLPRVVTASRAAPAVGLAAVAVGAFVLTVVRVDRTPEDARAAAGQQNGATAHAAQQASELLDRPAGDGTRLAVRVTETGFYASALTVALAYRLRTLGWTPTIDDWIFRDYVDDHYYAAPDDPVLTVKSGPRAATPPAPGARRLGTISADGLDPPGPRVVWMTGAPTSG